MRTVRARPSGGDDQGIVENSDRQGKGHAPRRREGTVVDDGQQTEHAVCGEGNHGGVDAPDNIEAVIEDLEMHYFGVCDLASNCRHCWHSHMEDLLLLYRYFYRYRILFGKMTNGCCCFLGVLSQCVFSLC